MNRNLTDIELSMVCEVIASHMGLHFPIERRAMLSRNLALAAREFGYNNMNGFIQWLLSATLNKGQIEILASYLTISETYFWREPRVFAAFSQNILAELVASKKERGKSITIWCAGCSTGEEAFSIAIALHRTIPEIKDWKITILATDINTKALSKARKGVYSSWSFRNSPSWLKNSYFKSINNKEYKIIPEIKKMVTFSSFNLTHENFLSSVCKNHKMDIIFCRNILMYFTSEWAAKVSQNLFHSLSEEGWLVVSSCELSSNLFPQLTPVNFPGAVLYCKTKKESTHSFNVQSNEIPEPYKQPFQPLFSEAIVKEDFQPLQPFNPPQQPQSIVKTPEETSADKIFAIRLLANQGHLEEALSICNEAIASYKLTPGLYFLRASILQELDKSNEAIKSLKQAIYIDPDYIMGHFTLGNLFIRQGNVRNAKQYFNNALELLSTCSNDDIPEESEGLSVKYLREIILANIQSQKTL